MELKAFLLVAPLWPFLLDVAVFLAVSLHKIDGLNDGKKEILGKLSRSYFTNGQIQWKKVQTRLNPQGLWQVSVQVSRSR